LIRMKRIVFYFLFWLALIFGATCVVLNHLLPDWLSAYRILIVCGIMGALGGVTYCLRGIYLSACVRKNWDETWQPWYYIRPIVSTICGGISYIFLKAGLLVLDAAQKNDAQLIGFYALAFIAGLNVDKFLAKLEDIAHASWGIERSRAAQSKDKES
jgi:hypothetical protein